jgi:serine/threonine protein phosphatase PrpC
VSAPEQVRLLHGATSHVGLVREANEDSLLVNPPVFVVADGMGGHDRGEVASALAVEALAVVAGQEPGDARATADAVDAALRDAQQRVAAYDAEQRAAGARRFASGTTVVSAVLSTYDGAPVWVVSNLGDSRAYGTDGTSLVRLSVDHSLVQELLDAGSITPEEARVHPERHVVTRALGASGAVGADHVLARLDVAPRLLLCSDGITDLVDDDTIARLLAAAPGPQEAADALVAAALAAGGIDNATAVVVDVVGWTSPDAGRRDVPQVVTDAATVPMPVLD